MELMNCPLVIDFLQLDMFAPELLVARPEPLMRFDFMDETTRTAYIPVFVEYCAKRHVLIVCLNSR